MYQKKINNRNISNSNSIQSYNKENKEHNYKLCKFTKDKYETKPNFNGP